MQRPWLQTTNAETLSASMRLASYRPSALPSHFEAPRRVSCLREDRCAALKQAMPHGNQQRVTACNARADKGLSTPAEPPAQNKSTIQPHSVTVIRKREHFQGWRAAFRIIRHHHACAASAINCRPLPAVGTSLLTLGPEKYTATTNNIIPSPPHISEDGRYIRCRSALRTGP